MIAVHVAIMFSCLLALTAIVAATAPATASAPVQSFQLEPGTPQQLYQQFPDVFAVTEFVISEPGGAPANQTQTRQAWENLQVSVVGVSGPTENWSVTDWSAGYFVLVLNMTAGAVSAVEAGQALVELSSTIMVGGVAIAASGQIDGAVLSSATPLSGWWVAWFGMPTPPPPVNSIEGAFAFLAWMDQSVTGRALYMLVTLVAVTIYVYEAHRLAKSKIVGHPARKPEAA